MTCLTTLFFLVNTKDVSMVMLDWLRDQPGLKGELRSARTTCGVQCAILHGTSLTPEWSVDNLVYL